MKKHYKNIIGCLLVCVTIVNSCSKKPTDYRSFLNGEEIIYPGKIAAPAVYPGNGRLMLTWHPSPDPSITKYVVYWNNNIDSVVFDAATHSPADTVKCIINKLSEYSYTFFVYSYDADGNKSLATEIDNAQVYGTIYINGLHNRIANVSRPSLVNADGSVTLNFLPPSDTINITTRIKYVNTNGDTSFKYLSVDSNAITLNDYKSGTRVMYQSAYIPKQGAIDTFYTSRYDTMNVFITCDKSLFSNIHLPYDMQPYDGGTYVARLWDGNMQPRGYPEIFHSDGNSSLPETITFDMGKIYNNLGRVEETGRNCCHNPSEFEIWGIADTTGAISSLPPNNGGWKADVMAKGWTLLKDIVRTDDGSAPFDADLISNPPPVRYIIIRVIQTVDQSNYVNMSQVTFWNKQ